MKALKKNDMGVSPVIAVILMVAITVVLAGVVFLWAQSFTDDTGDDVKTLNIQVTLDAGAAEVTDTDGVLEIEVLGGTITWADYNVKVVPETGTITTGAASSATSNAGDTVTFTATGIVKGTSYKVQIVDLDNNKVIFNDDSVIAIGA